MFVFCSDGRVLSDPFMKLPSRRALADYYEVIKTPMDIQKILTRVEDARVSSQFVLISKAFFCMFL